MEISNEKNTQTLLTAWGKEDWEIKKVIDKAGKKKFAFTKAQAEYIFDNLSFVEADKVKNGEDVSVFIWDIDTHSEYEVLFGRMKYRPWPWGCTYGFKRDWDKHFVNRRRLEKGEEIGIHVMPNSTVFHFSVIIPFKPTSIDPLDVV